jgi:hypothetical protein
MVSALFRMQIYKHGRKLGPFRPICRHRGVILVVLPAAHIQTSFVLPIFRQNKTSDVQPMSLLFQIPLKKTLKLTTNIL